MVTAAVARLLAAIVSSQSYCHLSCVTSCVSNLECTHCVTLILLELESVTQAAAFLLISGDNIPGPGHWLPGHRYRDTAGYTDMMMQSMDTEQLPRPCT